MSLKVFMLTEANSTGMDTRRVLYKAGGIACVLVATWLLTLIGPGAGAEGYPLVGSVAISLYSLGGIGLFGRKLGIKIYYLSGLMFLASAAIVIAVSAWAYVTGPSAPVFVLTIPFLIMCIMLAVGLKIMLRGDVLEGADYLLTKWNIGTIMDWSQAKELVVIYNRDVKRLEDPEKSLGSVSDYLDELEAQGCIACIGAETSSHSERSYKRIK